MSAPPAIARQADIERAVRALKACGCEHVRVVVTRDAVVVEAAPEPVALDNALKPRKPEVIIDL